jgi:electron transfer flavoprotein beta subunit
LRGIYTSNPTDDWAVAEALRLGVETVTVFAIGPERVEPLLRDYLAAGADDAVRVWDPTWDDVGAAERARLAAGVMERMAADLLICGSRLGARHARVLGPMAAEFLDVSQVTSTVRIAADGDCLLAQRRVDGFVETVRCPLPAVVTVDRGRPLPYPRLPNRIRARTATIAEWDPAEMAIDTGRPPVPPPEVVAISTPKPQRKTAVDPRPALERTFDLLLGGGGSSGGGDVLDGADPETADLVVARCLPVLSKR